MQLWLINWRGEVVLRSYRARIEKRRVLMVHVAHLHISVCRAAQGFAAPHGRGVKGRNVERLVLRWNETQAAWQPIWKRLDNLAGSKRRGTIKWPTSEGLRAGQSLRQYHLAGLHGGKDGGSAALIAAPRALSSWADELLPRTLGSRSSVSAASSRRSAPPTTGLTSTAASTPYGAGQAAWARSRSAFSTVA
jgi:hypothetical protein